MEVMKYKNYIASIHYSDEDSLFWGEVEGINDLITFDATNVKELKENFHYAVDDYIEFCKEIGKEPEKRFSGKLMLRITPQMHKDLFYKSKAEGLSINDCIVSAIKKDMVGTKINQTINYYIVDKNDYSKYDCSTSNDYLHFDSISFAS